MNALLKDLYYNPKTGFVSATKLYNKAKAINPRITLNEVRRWYKSQPLIQQHSTQRAKYPEFKIASLNPNEWQMDLAFWRKQPILITVNINSRIGFAKLLRDKKAPTVEKAIIDFIEEHKPNAIMSDNGSEFMNETIQKLFEEKSITHANSIAGDHTVLGKIDRFIRTIKARLTKMHESKKFTKLTQRHLNDAIENYNETHHSSINATPNDMEGRVIFDEVNHNKNLVKKIQNGFPEGSKVRYKLASKQFSKEGARYSQAVYEVVGLDGLKMRIRSKNNQILYKPINDLKKVDAELTETDFNKNQIYEAEKILEHKKLKNGKFKYLVKWRGYPENEATWEGQDNLRLINKNRQSELEKKYFEQNEVQRLVK